MMISTPFQKITRAWLLICVLLAVGGARGAEALRTLSWDENEKTYIAQSGETVANFEFTATNRTAEPVLVFEAVPSCGCTTARLPSEPWSLAVGASGVLKVAIDLAGKHGDLEKTVEVRSSAGNDVLRLRVFIPESLEEKVSDQRAGNMQLARADRQAVFKGSCASCHVPAKPGLTGVDLFRATCAICHESSHRASMVPDLAQRGAGQNTDYWKKWIESGREGSLMPAFAVENRGILTPRQVDELVQYLTKRYGASAKEP